MESVRKQYYQEREILIVDYSQSKPEDMIHVFHKGKALVLKENKAVLVLSIFGRKNYATPGFIRQLEKELPEVESLIKKNAVIGLTEIQKWILKGVNLWYKRQIHYFNSEQAALEFLVNEDKG